MPCAREAVERMKEDMEDVTEGVWSVRECQENMREDVESARGVAYVKEGV